MITLNAFYSLPPQLAPPSLRARPFSIPSKPRSFIPAKGDPLLPIKAVTEDKGLIPPETDADPDGDEKGSVIEEFEGFGNGVLGGIVGSGARDGEGGSGLSKIEGFRDWVFSKNSPDRLLNAAIVLGAGSFAITKLLTIDRDYWHGWTFYEVLRYAPEHNWLAYEEALKEHPVLSKMAISGIVYSLGDWIAQCYEGRPLLEFDRKRVFRSGLVGFTLHGSLSHYYYQFCESLFPLKEWWVVLAKVALDQTVWSGVWNSIYFMLLGFLRLESPVNIFDELKSTFWPLLTAGWKLWPFAHLITYGVIPVEQRLLWVDCVELIWVTILSSYSNEKKEVRISEVSETELHFPPEESRKDESK